MLGVSDYAEKAELIDRLVQGIEERRATFITYQSLQATEPVSYDVYPYGVIYHHGSLYLVGLAPEHEQIRHWKVDRIEDVELTDFPFQLPDGFDLQDHLSKSFGIFHGEGDIRIAVRFSPTVARYVQEKHWHESQKLAPQPDGSLLAEFRLGSTEEIKSWLLSFGKNAVVLAPESLRQEMTDEFEAALIQYRQKRQPARDPHRQNLPRGPEP